MAEKRGDRYKMYQYMLTGDPSEADSGYDYSREVQEKVQKAYEMVKRKKRDAVPKLQKLVLKYPHVPAFKNYLATYYVNVGKEEKAYQANKWLVKEHPNYLFGRLNLAGQYLLENRYEEIPKVLGAEMELLELYPERKIFHIGEYQGFFNIACRYYIAIDELEVAESKIEAAKQVLPNKELTDRLREDLENRRQELEYEAEQKDARTPKGRGYDVSKQTNVAPTFIHPEIKQLYRFGLDIDHSILQSILALPPSTLQQDLEAVLTDSINRYEYFSNKEEHIETECYFPLHALFLLTELNTTQSLPITLAYLKNDEIILEFWLDDHYTETIWELIYFLGKNKLDLLKTYLLESNISGRSKITVTSAVTQIVSYQPELKSEIINWYKEVLHYFFANLENDDLIDSELITFILIEVVDLGAKELLPEIKTAYAHKLVSLYIIGDYEEMLKELNSSAVKPTKMDIFNNIFERYEHILTHWYGERDEEKRVQLLKRIEELEAEKRQLKRKQQITEEKILDLEMRQAELDGLGEFLPPKKASTMPKVGRNEPCPCGSEKKYKKCCLKKH